MANDIWGGTKPMRVLRPWALLEFQGDNYIHDPTRAETKHFRYLKDIELSQAKQNGMQWNATIFDPKGSLLPTMSKKIHDYLADQKDTAGKEVSKVTIQVGWASGTGIITKSPKFNGFMTDLEPTFESGGVSIRMSGVCWGTLAHTQIDKAGPYSGTLKEAIEQIFEKYGYKVEFSEDVQIDQANKTKKWASGNNIIAVVRKWLQMELPAGKDHTYIIDYDSVENKFIISTSTHTGQLFDKPIQIGAPRSKNEITTVIRFSPEIRGLKLATLVAQSGTINGRERAATTSKKTGTEKQEKNRKNVIGIQTNVSSQPPDMTVTDEDVVKAVSTNMEEGIKMYSGLGIGLRAELEVLGIASLEPLSAFAKQVTIQNSPPFYLDGSPLKWRRDDQFLGYLVAGKWQCFGIKHKVSEAGFTTVLFLAKPSAGPSDGAK